MAKKKTNKKSYKRLLQFIAVCVVILLNAVANLKTSKEKESNTGRYTEHELQTDSGKLITRTWRDFSHQNYKLEYFIESDDLNISHQAKNEILIPRSKYNSHEVYWETVYSEFLLNEHNFITKIADSLRIIRTEQKLTKREFAETIMTFVQDIKYSFVFEGRMCAAEHGKLCVDDQRFGLHTPTEFLYTLLGDCDTRAVLLYGIYRIFGYDAKIAISLPYRHAMILIDIPTSGKYLNEFGKKYYFWETTAYGWKLGHLPPDMSDVSKWKIVL